MVKHILTLAIAAVSMSSMALAQEVAKDPAQQEPATTGSTQQTEVKLTEVRFCPMMGHAVAGEGAGQRVYKNYRVYFC